MYFCLYIPITDIIVLINWLPLWFLCRLGSVLHKDVGRGQPGAPGGGLDSALSARRWELGPDRHQENVALRKRPRSHHHRQIRPVSGCFLPGVPTGQWCRHLTAKCSTAISLTVVSMTVIPHLLFLDIYIYQSLLWKVGPHVIKFVPH